MSQTTEELKQEARKTLGLLQTLRDEVRLKIHLASMDAKDEWAKLEDELERVEADSIAALEGLLTKLRGFRSKIG